MITLKNEVAEISQSYDKEDLEDDACKWSSIWINTVMEKQKELYEGQTSI